MAPDLSLEILDVLDLRILSVYSSFIIYDAFILDDRVQIWLLDF